MVDTTIGHRRAEASDIVAAGRSRGGERMSLFALAARPYCNKTYASIPGSDPAMQRAER
jgi:hypothetical protein